MLERVFLHLINMSFTSSIVIAAVLLLRLLLKKAPRRFSYLLWAVVLFRLLCPFTLESSFSLVRVNPTPLSSDVIHSDAPQVNTGLPVVDDAINGTLTDAVPNTPQTPPQNIPQTPSQDITPNVPSNPGVSQPPSQDVTPDTPLNTPVTTPETPAETVSAWHIAAWVWIGGIGVMAIYSVVSLLHLRRRLVGATPLCDNVWLADHIDTAFVLGLFRPKIYIPSTTKEQEREYILMHERTHIQHGDHIVRLIAFIVLAVYWFHPLVWVAFLLSTRDMEMACDESVLKKLGPDIRTAYSQSLLNFATGRRRIAATPLAFGEDNPKSRIRNILSYKKPTLWAIIAGVTACCVAAVCLLTTATPAKPTDDDVDGGTDGGSTTKPQEDEIISTGDETGVWHRVAYAEDGEDTLTEYELTIEKENDTRWYTLKVWDYVPKTDGVVALKDVEPITYDGKTYVANHLEDSGRKQAETDEYGNYIVDANRLDGVIVYHIDWTDDPISDYLIVGVERRVKFIRSREMPMEPDALLGDWYYLLYNPNGSKPWFDKEHIHISKTESGLRIEKITYSYAHGGTDFTYDGNGFTLTERKDSSEIAGIVENTLFDNDMLNPFRNQYIYQKGENILRNESNDMVYYGRNENLPDIEQYRPFLKEWEYAAHRWNGGKESFYSSSLRFSINNIGLLLESGESEYGEPTEYTDPDHYRFKYNGKDFAFVGGGGGCSLMIRESENVLVESDSDPRRFVLDPEKETLTVTEAFNGSTETTVVYDTKMSAEDGIFVELGDITPNEDKYLGDWYNWKYEVFDEQRLSLRHLHIEKTEEANQVNITETYVTYWNGGTDLTYNGIGFKETNRHETKKTFTIYTDALRDGQTVYKLEGDALINSQMNTRYVRDDTPPDPTPYLPYMKDWWHVDHWWRDGIEYFSIATWDMSLTTDGFKAVNDTEFYVADKDLVPASDLLYIQVNGKYFIQYDDQGFTAHISLKDGLVQEGTNYVGATKRNDFRFVLDPDKETLTVTTNEYTGVSTTIVYDTRMSAENGIYVDLGDLSNPTNPQEAVTDTGDESGVWHYIEQYENKLVEYELTVEKEASVLWATLKKWVYEPKSDKITALSGFNSIKYNGKIFMVTQFMDSGRTRCTKDDRGRYRIQTAFCSHADFFYQAETGQLTLTFNLVDMLIFTRARTLPNGAQKVPADPSVTNAEDKFLGDWYFAKYNPNALTPSFTEEHVNIFRADGGLRAKVTTYQYAYGGTDFTYDGKGFALTERSVREAAFDIYGDSIHSVDANFPEFTYLKDEGVLYSENRDRHYGRSRALPDIEPYRPYLKTWKYIKYYWQHGQQHFGTTSWEFMITNTGLIAGLGEATYAEATRDYTSDDYKFQYNGTNYVFVGGGSRGARVRPESKNVLAGSALSGGGSTYRFVLDPQKETLTVTETYGDKVYTTVFDTKMNIENGIFDGKEDLPPLNPESLNLWADGEVRFVPTDTKNGTELLLAEEDAVKLADMLNAYKWESKAYKGTGDYIFTIDGHEISVDVEECWFNLLDGNGTPMMKSVKLQDATHIDAFKDLLAKATEA